MTRETRHWRVPALELRANGDTKTIEGYAAVFNRLSQNLGGFVEMIDPSAFNDTLARNNAVAHDLKSYWNHNGSQFLGRQSAGNLIVERDDTGVLYSVTPPLTSYARDLMELVAARMVLGSSFTFRVLPDGDTWSLTEQGFPLRTIVRAEMFELGPVSDPAYLATEGEGASVALRSLAARLNRPEGEVIEAAQANELRAVLTAEDTTGEVERDTQTVPLVTAARQRLALTQRRR